MIEFKVLKKSKKSNARLGILKTPHGEIETPALVPVATQATIKALTSEEVEKTKTQILIANTFHLHLKPGENVIKSAGGLHKFMNWQKPLMTDSAGFQVFSLGFGRDFGIGKILKNQQRTEVKSGQQPKLLRITDEGVFFTSFLDGTKLFLGPKESIKIQEALGGDIMFAFDECPPPNADYAYVKKSLERTNLWAKKSLQARKSKQALFGIVQGGKFKDLRLQSAKFINSLAFDGFGIGGEFGANKKTMAKILSWITDVLPEKKPRHLLGIGHPEDIPILVRTGIDMFDCIAPTHYARHGIAFTSKGKLDMMHSIFLNPPTGGKKPLDQKCDCRVCQNYSRAYIAHLIRAKEITALSLLTFHNLFFFNSLVERLRNDIKKDTL